MMQISENRQVYQVERPSPAAVTAPLQNSQQRDKNSSVFHRPIQTENKMFANTRVIDYKDKALNLIEEEKPLRDNIGGTATEKLQAQFPTPEDVALQNDAAVIHDLLEEKEKEKENIEVLKQKQEESYEKIEQSEDYKKERQADKARQEADDAVLEIKEEETRLTKEAGIQGRKEAYEEEDREYEKNATEEEESNIRLIEREEANEMQMEAFYARQERDRQAEVEQTQETAATSEEIKRSIQIKQEMDEQNTNDAVENVTRQKELTGEDLEKKAALDERLNEFVDKYNQMMDEDISSALKSRVTEEFQKVSERHQDILDEVGIEITQEGKLQINQQHLEQADMRRKEELLNSRDGFVQEVKQKARHVAQNPMNYYEKDESLQVAPEDDYKDKFSSEFFNYENLLSSVRNEGNNNDMVSGFFYEGAS